MTKHTPTYNLTVRYVSHKGPSPADWKTLEISAPFTKWFSADGHFIAKPFQHWLASEIPLVGEADPSKIVRTIEEDKTESEARSAVDSETAASKPKATKSRRGKK